MAEALPILDDVVIECPICLELLKEPRTLPCHHTFCDDCLITYVGTQKACSSEFPCPVCRESTKVSGYSLTGEKWTQAFDADKIIVKMMKASELKDKTYQCHLCLKKENKNTQATIRCLDCVTFMCELCENVHDYLLPNHSKVNLNTLAKENQHVIEFELKDTRCEKHAHVKDMYCSDDDEVICVKCATTLHRHCKKVVDLQDHVSDIKSAVSNDLKELQNFHESVKNATRSNKSQIEFLKQQQENVKSKIRSRQEQINKHYHNLNSQLDLVVLTEQTHLEKERERYEKLSVAIEQSQKFTNSCIQYGSHHQILEWAHKMKHDIIFFKKEVSPVSDCKKDIHIFTSLNANHFLKLHVNNSRASTCTANNNRYLEQSLSCPYVPMRRRKLYHIETLPLFSERKHICYTGVQFLDDRRLVLCDKINCVLQLYDVQQPFSPLHEIGFEARSSVWGLCKMSENQIAVSHPTEKRISVVCVVKNKLRVKYKFNVGKSLYGIDSRKDMFYVTCPDEIPDTIIEVWTHDGQKIRDIKNVLFKRKMWYLKINEQTRKIVVTQEGCTALVLDLLGTVLRRIDHPMLPCGGGIDFDEQNFLYVCGTDSSIVLQVNCNEDVNKNTPRVIMERKFPHPVTISCFKNMLAVSDKNMKEISVFVMV